MAADADVLQVRHPAANNRGIQVFVGRAIETDDNHRPRRRGIDPSIDTEGSRAEFAHAFQSARAASTLPMQSSRMAKAWSNSAREIVSGGVSVSRLPMVILKFRPERSAAYI